MIFHNFIGSVAYKFLVYLLITAMTATSSIPIMQRVQTIAANAYAGLVQRMDSESSIASTASAMDAITAALPRSVMNGEHRPQQSASSRRSSETRNPKLQTRPPSLSPASNPPTPLPEPSLALLSSRLASRTIVHRC